MIESLSQRTRVILLGGLATAIAFVLFGGARSSGGGRDGDPFDAVPKDSFLVATLNLTELRRSPLYEVLLGKEAGGSALASAKTLGIAKLADSCGFDPLSRVDRLAVAVPEEGDKGELGVAAHVTVTREELAQCTSAMAEGRGGKVETKELGSFVVVEDRSSLTAARPRLGYGHGGLLVVGRGAWFDAMIESADGKKPGVRDAEAHIAMRSSLTSRDGWRAPTLVISALLPRTLRERLKGEMGAEIGSKDTSQKAMAGVLGVSTVGLALKAGEQGQNTDAAIELVCDTPEGCAEVERLVLKKRLEWNKELMLRMVGFGALLDSIEVKRDGARLRVTASAPALTLAATIERVLRLKARPPAEEPQPAPRVADEVLPSKPADGGTSRDAGLRHERPQ